MRSSVDDDDLYDELNILKKEIYNKESKEKRGFNNKDGFFYTGVVDLNGSSEIIYRDKSDNLSVHSINEDYARLARQEYNNRGIPLDMNELSVDKKTGGDPSQEMKNPLTPVLHAYTTPKIWDSLGMKEMKIILKEKGLKVSGNKASLIKRLTDNNIIYNAVTRVNSLKNVTKKQSLSDNAQGKSNNSTRSKKSHLSENSQNKSNNSQRKNSVLSNNTKKKLDVQSTKVEKKRKNVDYNAFELIMALILKHNVTNFAEIDSLIKKRENLHLSIGLEQLPYNKFVEDYNTRSSKMVEKYVVAFGKTNASNLINIDKIESVELSGKGGDKNEKSDIFFYYKDNVNRYGMSVKQSKDATLSNYSVTLILNEITKGKTISKNLQDIKYEYIKNERGLTINDKSDRAGINASFYNHFENPYWNEMRSVISNNSNEIGKRIFNSVFCANTQTIVYEYDGSTLSKFEPRCILSANIEEDKGYYKLPNGKPRSAAKLFYNLTIDEKPVYRCEIRHKGSFTASPQFMLFKIK